MINRSADFAGSPTRVFAGSPMRVFNRLFVGNPTRKRGRSQFPVSRFRVGFPFPSIFLINKFAGPSTREFLTANGRE